MTTLAGLTSFSDVVYNVSASPPLPPPPPADQNFEYPAAPPPAQFTDIDEEMVHEEDPYAPTGPMNLLTQDWVPNQYLEKGMFILRFVVV